MARRIRQNLQPFDTSKEAAGKRMIQVREAWGLNQKQMAAEIGISNSGLNKIEKGVNRISTMHALIVWQKFGAPVEWIQTGFADNLSGELRKRLRHGPPSPAEPSDPSSGGS